MAHRRDGLMVVVIEPSPCSCTALAAVFTVPAKVELTPVAVRRTTFELALRVPVNLPPVEARPVGPAFTVMAPDI